MGREIGLGQVTHQLEIAVEDFGSLSLKEDFKIKTLTTNNLDHYHN